MSAVTPGSTRETTPRPSLADAPDHDLDPLAPLAVLVGLALLIAAVATLGKIPHWADEYSHVLVYLAFVLYMTLAGRLTWWGIDTLTTRLRHRA
ncbi:hypothetical protein [Nocardia terpenica]|uniref:Uncharacterized protein n=1 Tax=Nocardia terpenica TaxID=455432 RepID=A0A6G9Z2F6_9NOCA|nr:hypothetical protein [Nocardia terpenica]QIS19785.1 hypothetical protein F6W96_17285 [Nocardia terpenica]